MSWLDFFKKSGWESDNCLKKVKNRTDGDTDKPERDEQKPDDRIKDQSKES